MGIILFVLAGAVFVSGICMLLLSSTKQFFSIGFLAIIIGIILVIAAFFIGGREEKKYWETQLPINEVRKFTVLQKNLEKKYEFLSELEKELLKYEEVTLKRNENNSIYWIKDGKEMLLFKEKNLIWYIYAKQYFI